MRVLTLAIALALAACVPHPVGPARTFGKYEGKAVTTAEAAVSAVQTARLLVSGATRHDLFGPYVSMVAGEAEDSVLSVSDTFGSIQPPGGRADALRDELLGALDEAADHLAAVRIAARRGEIDKLASIGEPLDADAKTLEDFVEAHRA